MNIYNDIFKIPEKQIKRFSLLNEADDESDAFDWRITFHLPNAESEYDDEFDTTEQEVVIQAYDAEDAVKYAEQYIRVQEKDNPEWKNAEILSVNRV